MCVLSLKFKLDSKHFIYLLNNLVSHDMTRSIDTLFNSERVFKLCLLSLEPRESVFCCMGFFPIGCCLWSYLCKWGLWWYMHYIKLSVWVRIDQGSVLTLQEIVYLPEN